jgi:uncharacterized protein YutE (UPF0331/DUF86 family)
MAKIDDEGLEKLQHIRNAIDVVYDKLDIANVFDNVAEEFEYIVEILEEAKNNWEKI